MVDVKIIERNNKVYELNNGVNKLEIVLSKMIISCTEDRNLLIEFESSKNFDLLEKKLNSKHIKKIKVNFLF